MNTLKTGLVVLAASVTMVSCKKDAPTISADKTTAEVGELVSLNCLATDETLKSSYVTWDFGDGMSTANGLNTEEIYNNNNKLVVSHSYDKAGTYTVAAIINKSKRPTKKNAASRYGTTTITVVSAKADFTASASSVVLGSRVAFSNTSTSNGNKIDEVKGYDLGFKWEVKNASTGEVKATATSRDFTYVFGDGAGTYTVTAWAMQGNSTTAKSMDITVTGGIDTESSVDKLLGTGKTVTVTGSASGAPTSTCNGSLSKTYSNATFKATSNKDQFEIWAVLDKGNQNYGTLVATVTLNSDGTADFDYSDPYATTTNLSFDGTYAFTSSSLKKKNISDANDCVTFASYSKVGDYSITW